MKGPDLRHNSNVLLMMIAVTTWVLCIPVQGLVNEPWNAHVYRDLDDTDSRAHKSFPFVPDVERRAREREFEIVKKTGTAYPGSDPTGKLSMHEEVRRLQGMSSSGSSLRALRESASTWTQVKSQSDNEMCTFDEWGNPRQQCGDNSHCRSYNREEWCVENDVASPCDVCTESGQTCHESSVCQDYLYRCPKKSDFDALLGNEPDHPCRNSICDDRTSASCKASVKAFCKKPSSSCTAGGCSRFLQDRPGGDSVTVKCPFDNSGATCESDQCKRSSSVEELYWTFGSNGHCYGSHCLSRLVQSLCKTGMGGRRLQEGTENSTDTSGSGSTSSGSSTESGSDSGSQKDGGNATAVRDENLIAILKYVHNCVENGTKTDTEERQPACEDERAKCAEDETCTKHYNEIWTCTSNVCLDSKQNSTNDNEAWKAVYECVGQSPCVEEAQDQVHAQAHGDRMDCAQSIFDYCQTEQGLSDEACQDRCKFWCDYGDECPCINSACKAVRESPICAKHSDSCSMYSKLWVQAFLNAGLYWSTNAWYRMENPHLWSEEAPNATTRANFDPHADATIGEDIKAYRDQCNAQYPEMADNLNACHNTTTSFCENEPWSDGCRALSTCGDGKVTWGEDCDDGNTENGDGCNDHCHTETGYFCMKPGLPCEICVRDQRAKWAQHFEEKICTFCINDRFGDLTGTSALYPKSPCSEGSTCSNMNDYTTAKRCDDEIDTYCNAVKAKSLHDPGCESHQPHTRLFTIPSIASNCEYRIKTFPIETKNVISVKVALFECTFQDEYGVTQDTTPVFRFVHPYNRMTKDDRDALSEDAKAIFDVRSTARNQLISLRDMRLADVYRYAHPHFVSKDGWELHSFGERIAHLEILPKNYELPENYPTGDEACWFHEENMQHRELWAIPPTTEGLKQALKALLLRAKWQAVNQEWSEWKDFENITTEDIDIGDPKNSTISFMTMLSTVRREWDGREREDAETICVETEGQHIEWHERSTHPNCTTIEQAIVDSGENKGAQIKFERQLFQSSCEDDDCDLKVDHCRRVPVAPRVVDISYDSFDGITDTLQSSIMNMTTNVTSWSSLIARFVSVASAGATMAYDDTLQLYNKLVVTGKQQKYLEDVPDYCDKDHWIHNDSYDGVNPEWRADPCCNWERREYECCAPQDVPNGFIDVVTGVNAPSLQATCFKKYHHNVSTYLQDLMKNLAEVQKNNNEIAQDVNLEAWELLWKGKDKCHQLMYNAGDKECTSDADCDHCTLSDCVARDGGTKYCTVPWDQTQVCMVDCLGKELGDTTIGLLKLHWGIPVNNSDTNATEWYKDEFEKKMTVDSCTGPRQWEEDIGYPRMEWICNTSCTADYHCDDWNYREHLMQVIRENSSHWFHDNYHSHHDIWQMNTNTTLCNMFDGEMSCQWHHSDGTCAYHECEFPFLNSTPAGTPCKHERKCWDKCGSVHMEAGCVSEGGTWINTTFTADNSDVTRTFCCPPDAYVYEAKSGETVCSYAPEGSANSWEIQDEGCCQAFNGTFKWQVSDGHRWGQCCLGKWRTHEWDGQVHEWCQETTHHWDRSDCYDKCEDYRSACKDCRVNREDCCSNKFISADKDNCLKYTQCTDGEKSDAQCNDATPFCSKCYGNWCHRVTSETACEYTRKWDQSSCSGIGGSWDSRHWRCTVSGTWEYTNSSAWSCFGNLTNICPDPKNVTELYSHEIATPAYPWRSVECESGCYQTDLSESECWQVGYWRSEYANGNGVCRVHVYSESTCTGTNQVWVPETKRFNPGRFTTEEQCNQGQCRGSLSWDGWNRSQCLDLSDNHCSQGCRECKTHGWEHGMDWSIGGSCFSMNATTCNATANSELEVYSLVSGSSTPCHLRALTESECTGNASALNVTWVSCTQFNANESMCSGSTTTYANESVAPSLEAYFSQYLKCSYDWQECKTQAACEAMGHCDDWDNQRHTCHDNDWPLSPEFCWGEHKVTLSDGNTTTEWKDCSDCRWYDGVCVVPRPSEGCELWHQKGCKNNNITSEADCHNSSIVANGTWYKRATSKEECLAIKGCKEPGQWHISLKDETQCSLCGGTQESVYHWNSARWSSAWIDEYTWQAEGAVLKSVNSWTATLADFKMVEELSVPLIQQFGDLKKTQAFNLYQVTSNALSRLACACGDTERDGCFDSDKVLNASAAPIAGTTRSLCGINVQQKSGFGEVNVAKDTCGTSSSGSRRLSSDSSSDEVAELTWTHHSAGSTSVCLEPHSSTTDRMLLNPLVLRNTKNVVYGQLIGDGKGFTAVGTFDKASFCLSIRADIRAWKNTFSVVDIAIQHKTNGSIEPLFQHGSLTHSNGEKVCIETTTEGVYFPIRRVPVSDLAAVEALTCAQNCVADRSLCAYNGTTSSSQCMCNCGFSGNTCDKGCLNSCSGEGSCNEDTGVCTCNAGRVGEDCSEYDCPIGKRNKRCSGQGECQSNATCSCYEGYSGVSCDTVFFKSKNVSVGGYTGLNPGELPNPTTPEVTGDGEDGDGEKPPTEADKPLNTGECAESKCKPEYDSCADTFGRCHCHAGFLSCMLKECTIEEHDITKSQCEKAMKEQESLKIKCKSSCEAGVYPGAGAEDDSKKVSYKIKASVALKGVSENDFRDKHQEAFKEAVAAMTPGVDVSQVKITDIISRTGGSRRRRLSQLLDNGKLDAINLFGVPMQHGGRRLDAASGAFLEVLFEIQVEDKQKFEEAKKVMTDEVNNSDGSSSTLAKNLVEKGVVDSLDSVAVLEMEVEIVVTEVESEGGFFSKVRNILILVGVALFLLLGMCIGCCCRKGKKPASPKVSNSNKQSK